MKKIAKENKLIIDELEVDVDFENRAIKNEGKNIMRKKWHHKIMNVKFRYNFIYPHFMVPFFTHNISILIFVNSISKIYIHF